MEIRVSLDEITLMWPPVLKAETPPWGGAVCVGVRSGGSGAAGLHLNLTLPFATCVTLANQAASTTSPVNWG